MSTPLHAFSKKYFKRPDCWRSLSILAGFLIVDKWIMDSYVDNYIFGKDGHGGEVLVIKSRMDEHEREFREERKKYYWHLRLQKFYIPSKYTLNTKLDYNTLSYNESHNDTWVDPKTIPSEHEAHNFNLNFLPEDYFHKD